MSGHSQPSPGLIHAISWGHLLLVSRTLKPPMARQLYARELTHQNFLQKVLFASYSFWKRLAAAFTREWKYSRDAAALCLSLS